MKYAKKYYDKLKIRLIESLSDDDYLVEFMIRESFSKLKYNSKGIVSNRSLLDFYFELNKIENIDFLLQLADNKKAYIEIYFSLLTLMGIFLITCLWQYF